MLLVGEELCSGLADEFAEGCAVNSVRARNRIVLIFIVLEIFYKDKHFLRNDQVF